MNVNAEHRENSSIKAYGFVIKKCNLAITKIFYKNLLAARRVKEGVTLLSKNKLCSGNKRVKPVLDNRHKTEIANGYIQDKYLFSNKELS